MARLKGFFVDYFTPSTDPTYKWQIKRKYFKDTEKRQYEAFLKQHKTRIRSAGKRFS